MFWKEYIPVIALLTEYTITMFSRRCYVRVWWATIHTLDLLRDRVTVACVAVGYRVNAGGLHGAIPVPDIGTLQYV